MTSLREKVRVRFFLKQVTFEDLESNPLLDTAVIPRHERIKAALEKIVARFALNGGYWGLVV